MGCYPKNEQDRCVQIAHHMGEDLERWRVICVVEQQRFGGLPMNLDETAVYPGLQWFSFVLRESYMARLHDKARENWVSRRMMSSFWAKNFSKSHQMTLIFQDIST